jgi:hypothetical protein
MVTGEKKAGTKEEEMNTRMTHEAHRPLAHFGRRVVAIVTELNRAQSHLASAQHTPERY